MTEHDDELERRVRASLDTHAGDVDTSVPVAARARAAARRHRGRWVAAGAAVAVAAVAVTVAVVDRAEPPSSEEPPVATPSPSPPVMSGEWRTEYWRGISVQVPAGWGWGAAPMTLDWDPDGGAVLCGGPGAMHAADGENLVNPDPAAAYVGRPVMISDLCWANGGSPAPATPYVWFDGSVEPGTVDLPNGYVQETVRVHGTTVTVGSDDQALRARILASVARQHLCPDTVDVAGLDLGGDALGGAAPQAARLCAYARQDDDGHRLVYGRELDAETIARFDRALGRAPEDVRICKAAGDLVMVTAVSGDQSGAWPVRQTWVADLACGTVASTGGTRRLTTSVVDSWADGGVRASVGAFNPLFR